MRQTPRNNRLSSVMEDSPGQDNSELTEQSTFSALASGKKTGSGESRSRGDERRVALGERSLAALTSGVSDSAWGSRRMGCKEYGSTGYHYMSSTQRRVSRYRKNAFITRHRLDYFMSTCENDG